MPSIDVRKQRIDSKIVYYGPGQSGKTANLKYIYDHLKPEQRGRLAALPTKADPGLYIHILPVRFGKILGLTAIFHLCCGPGPAFAVNTRKLLLKDCDGIIFVADPRPSRREANIDSLHELKQNLADYGLNLATIPHVFQYNKRDLQDRLSAAELRSDLNRYGVPDYEASALEGQGIMETLRALINSVSQDLQKRL